jgi:methyl-accepting chemotaxis protein
MIQGYTQLNENISRTINLIKDVEASSKEQQQGIEQINDAVTSLDQQTQQNAMIASQTHDVAVQTDTIAKLVVQDANAKEFPGKNQISAKIIDQKVQKNTTPDAQTNPTKNPPKQEKKIDSQTKITPITSNSKDEDEWTSF